VQTRVAVHIRLTPLVVLISTMAGVIAADGHLMAHAAGESAVLKLRRGETAMIGIGISFSTLCLGFLFWLLFDLYVYALRR
jgi:hypothetical protein